MKIVYKYLIKKFVGPFALTFSFSLVIFLMQFLWLYVDELVGKGLEIYIILQFLFYASASFVASSASLGILLSSLMTFGAMGEHYELVALKSAGISITTLMIPLSVFTIFIGIISFVFSDSVAPRSFLKQKNLIYNIKDQKPTLAIDEGVFYEGIDNYIIRIGKKHRDNERIEDVLIYDHSGYKGNTTMTYAQRGSMKVTPDGKYMLFYLYDGYLWDENKKYEQHGEVNSLTRAKFKEQYKRLDISSFKYEAVETSFYETNTKALSNTKIQEQIDTMKNQLKDISKIAVRNFYNNLQYLDLYLKQDTTFYVDSLRNIHAELSSLSHNQQKEQIARAIYTEEFLSNSVKFAFEEAGYRNQNLWSYEIEWHRKYTLAFSCFLFFFIGAPLGSIIRKGGIGIPLLITVLFFVLYFAFSIMGEKMAKGSLFPVPVGMWLSSIILIPICIFLTRKATNDSMMLSRGESEKWISWIASIAKFYLPAYFVESIKEHENISDLS